VSAARPRQIVVMGGGSFSVEPDGSLLDAYVLELSGKPRPRICFVPTASGDSSMYITKFYEAFGGRAEASHLGLFGRPRTDMAAVLAGQDIVYVGGGNTANMLAVWRVHGVDRALRRAWEAGVVMTGLSAGSICWFEAGTTDSFGVDGPLSLLSDALGFLPGSHSPHYDGEPGRRPTYQGLVSRGELPDGYAADDRAGLVFRGTDLVEVVASRPAARGYRVERGSDGQAVETELPTRYLG
jgi:dipeptidase E